MIGRFLSPPVFLLLSAAAILAAQYFTEIDQPNKERRLVLHAQVLDGTAVNPYRYRVLAPLVVDLMMRAESWIDPKPQRLRPSDSGSTRAFLLSYLVFDLACIAAGLLILFAVLRLFFSVEYSLAGSLFAALAYSLTFRDQFFHPWSLLEFPLFGAACWLIFRERYKWLWLVVAIGALNRETSIFILAILLFSRVLTGRRVPGREHLVRLALLTAIWSVITAAVYWYQQLAPPGMTVAQALRSNLDPAKLQLTLVLNTVLFGGFWVFVVRGLFTAPPFLARAAIAVVPYLGTLLVIGYWNEIRYWVSLFPILIPLGLFGMKGRAPKSAD